MVGALLIMDQGVPPPPKPGLGYLSDPDFGILSSDLDWEYPWDRLNAGVVASSVHVGGFSC